MAEAQDMWRCQMVNCGYVYDPDRGDKRHKIPAGTKFEDLPDDWRCPVWEILCRYGIHDPSEDKGTNRKAGFDYYIRRVQRHD